MTDDTRLVPPRWMDTVAAFVVICITATEVFTTIAPYFGMAPAEADPTLTAQQQAIMQNVFIACVSFLTGASVSTRKQTDTISTMANTIEKAAVKPTEVAP